MNAEKQKYWNLSQAAAWVVFRNMAVVDRFTHPSDDGWSSFMFYPDMRKEFTEHGVTTELFDKLRSGQLIALGRRGAEGAMFEVIPPVEWHDLVCDVAGPYRRLETGVRDQPWREIRVLRADVEKGWRRLSETQARSKYDKPWIKNKFVELRRTNQALSQNELIVEIESQYQEEKNKKPPSRTTIQRYIAGL